MQTGAASGVASRAQFFMQKQQDAASPSSPGSTNSPARPLPPNPKLSGSQTTAARDESSGGSASLTTSAPPTLNGRLAGTQSLHKPSTNSPHARRTMAPTTSAPSSSDPGAFAGSVALDGSDDFADNSSLTGSPKQGHVHRRSVGAVTSNISRPLPKPKTASQETPDQTASPLAASAPLPDTSAPSTSGNPPVASPRKLPKPQKQQQQQQQQQQQPQQPQQQPATIPVQSPSPASTTNTNTNTAPASNPIPTGPSSPDPRSIRVPGSPSPGTKVARVRAVSERPPIPKTALPPRPQNVSPFSSQASHPTPVAPGPASSAQPPVVSPRQKPPQPRPLSTIDTATATVTTGPAVSPVVPATADGSTSATPPITTPEKKDAPPAQDTAKMARLRIKVVEELVETERMYIKDLEVLIKIFLFPLQAMAFLPEQGISTIFSNVEILLNVNKEFLANLDAQLSQYGADDANLPLGDVFRKMGDYFKMYTTYCANHPIAVSTVAKLEETNPEFQNYLRICHTDKEVEGRRIYDYLIKPVQRLCKYPLLIRELMRNTQDTHPDYELLLGAQKKIDEVVDYINERKRNAEGNQIVFDIQIQTEGSHLVSPTRHLVKEGILMSHDPKNFDSKPQKLIVFLFNDLMVLVRPKAQKYFEKDRRKKNCFALKAKVPLGNAKLISMSMEKAKIDNCFQMQYSPEGEDGDTQTTKTLSLTLSAESQADQLMWTKDIKLRIREYQKRKYLESQRAPGSPAVGSMITTITRSKSSAAGLERPINLSASTSSLPRVPSQVNVLTTTTNEPKDVTPPVSPSNNHQATTTHNNSHPTTTTDSSNHSSHSKNSSAPINTNNTTSTTNTPNNNTVNSTETPASPLSSSCPSPTGWGFSPSVRRKRDPLSPARGGLGSSRREKMSSSPLSPRGAET
eukprot:TRINITY_DN1699_c0_g1_i2.p1 TRINITY_DN1699_c0_g1~~TRINITY_DN1699_c0_g1_i2.p1  ORF type:complete len:913 (+),score=168.52 TRINITY_DN1699_c0_g1_i2:275-3013(+)